MKTGGEIFEDEVSTEASEEASLVAHPVGSIGGNDGERVDQSEETPPVAHPIRAVSGNDDKREEQDIPIVTAVPVFVDEDTSDRAATSVVPAKDTSDQATPVVVPASAQLDPTSALALSIQNTLNLAKINQTQPSSPAVKNAGDTSQTSSAREECAVDRDQNPKSDDDDAGVEAAGIDNGLKGENANANTEQQLQTNTDSVKTPDSNPGLWKLTGRKIKQYKVGKLVLHGIRDGMNATAQTVNNGIQDTKKTMGIGVGKIMICVPPTVFQLEQSVCGHIEFDLTEPIPADSLMIRLEGIQEKTVMQVSTSSSTSNSRRRVSNSGTHAGPRTERKVIYNMEYAVCGKQDYPCSGKYPFQVLIPRLKRKMSDETRGTVVGSIISSVQAISDSMSSPIEWYLVATLAIPWRLNMSHRVRLHVADEAY